MAKPVSGTLWHLLQLPKTASYWFLVDEILSTAHCCAIFIWLAPKLFGGLASVLSPNYVVANGQTAVQGKTSNHSANRGKYRFSLEGRGETFDFDNFQNQALWVDGWLASYLANGDSVSKSADSPVLIVSSNGQLSQWKLVAPDPYLNP